MINDNTIIETGLIFPKKEYNLVFKTCFFHINHIIFAFYYEMYFCGYIDIILFGTSLNYWRYPLNISIRRYIDITWVSISISYHLYLSLYLKTLLSTMIILNGIFMYPLSNYYLYIDKNYKYSAYLHSLLHVFCSIGACILYKHSYEEYINQSSVFELNREINVSLAIS